MMIFLFVVLLALGVVLGLVLFRLNREVRRLDANTTEMQSQAQSKIKQLQLIGTGIAVFGRTLDLARQLKDKVAKKRGRDGKKD